MRIRCAGLVKMEDGYAFMHRMNVKPTEGTNKPYGEYYVFPGGGLEGNETLEECAKREILEEFGIEVNVGRKLYERAVNEEKKEYVFLCEYVSGVLGTGTGPEFSGDPKYADRGDYIPTIVKIEDIENIRLYPEEFKNKLLEDIKNNNL
jgi:8-oxo-dGTP pyrophosphatase MutT (NUDIX family)